MNLRLLRQHCLALSIILITSSLPTYAQNNEASQSSDSTTFFQKSNQLDPDFVENYLSLYSTHAAFTAAEKESLKKSATRMVAALRQNKVNDRECVKDFVSDVTGGKFSHFLILKILENKVGETALPSDLKSEIARNLTRFTEGLRQGSIRNDTAREIFERKVQLNDQAYKEIGEAVKRAADKAKVENKNFEIDIAEEFGKNVTRCL